MLRFYADKFLFVMNVLTSLRFTFDTYPPGTTTGVKLSETEEMGSGLRHLVAIFTELEMPVSRANAQALLEMYDKKQSRPMPDVKTLVGLMYNSAMQEFNGRLLIGIKPSEAQFYEPKAPLFGPDVLQKFPTAIYEIDEAAKCLALDRSTASAFHSIRSLEAGIGALSRCLGIPDPTKAADRNWGAVLGKIKAAIDAKWPSSSDRLSGDGEFFDNAYAALAAMRNPWRNATMHLDQKYTPEEARHIFEVIKGFMMKLASRLDESGQPVA